MWARRMKWQQMAQHMVVCNCVAVSIAKPLVSIFLIQHLRHNNTLIYAVSTVYL